MTDPIVAGLADDLTPLFDSAVALKHILEKVVEHDTDYVVRYGLVFQAVSFAIMCGHTAGIALDPAEPDWPVVYIELPTGQISWHMPRYANEFDGHTPANKFARIREYIAGSEGE